MKEPARPPLDLEDARTWRAMLGLLFGLALLARFLVYTDLTAHPAGAIEEWPGTEAWLAFSTGRAAAAEGNWALEGTNLLLTRAMRVGATQAEWQAWTDNRLPRGAVVPWLMAAGHVLTPASPMAVYRAAALVAGALLAPLVAIAGAGLFRRRTTGLAAGLLAASHQNLVVTTVVPSPAMWEALALAGLLAAAATIAREPRHRSGWVGLGLATGLGLWLRPMFGWGVVVGGALALRHWGLVGRAALLAAGVAGLLALLLVGRNMAAGSTPLPVVGHPGWALVRTIESGESGAFGQEEDLLLMEASGGRLGALVPLVATSASPRSDFLRALPMQLRRWVGARDVAWTFSFDYIARRSEVLRMVTLPSDVTMAVGWAAALFLFLRRGFPALLGSALGVLTVHGVLFGAMGIDRAVLHVVLALVAAGGFLEAWRACFRAPHVAFGFLLLWAAVHVGLQIDDHARGSRYRAYDFLQAINRLPAVEDRNREVMDYRNIRQTEKSLLDYWNTTPPLRLERRER